MQSPAGAKQWQPKEVKDGFMVPPVEPGAPETKPTMSTADMAMITDPAYLEISKRFYENPDQLADAVCQGLVQAPAPRHGSSHPLRRTAGPGEEFLWQDNVPAHEGAMIGDAEIAELKSTILDSGLTHRPVGEDRVGLGLDLPPHRLPRGRQRRSDPAVAA